jgi:N6-adenosine-specific RNA methylase IME4
MKKYQVIYADPPWHQKRGREFGGYVKKDGKQIFNVVNNSSAALPYPTMSLEQIKQLRVRDIAADDCHLYMWTTNKYLPKAFEVIKAWGFEYSTTITWCKKPLGGGLGGTFRVTTEHLIFAKRGSLPARQIIKGTWFEEKRPYVNGYPVHSKKPEFFRQLIELVSPGNKIELFARERVTGWDAWGNEVETNIQL